MRLACDSIQEIQILNEKEIIEFESTKGISSIRSLDIETRAGFHTHLIRLEFHSKYFMDNYTYFRQTYQEC